MKNQESDTAIRSTLEESGAWLCLAGMIILLSRLAAFIMEAGGSLF